MKQQLQQSAEPFIRMRAGQRKLFQLVDVYRMIAFVARRQYGKTTTFGNIALKKMMQNRDHTIIFGSAKLNLSREIVRKESSVLERSIAEAVRQSQGSADANPILVADGFDGKIPDALTHDDFAELFEASRLEFRYYHTRSSYSRTKVVALRPDTVGETGDLMADEVGRINNWQEVWEAIEPIVASNPTFKLLLSTTPPPDDAHYSFEQLCPPPGTIFPINPEGNLYESVKEVTVQRVDAFDAYADNVPLYDLKSGKPMSPDESRAKAFDKEAWDRNYGCIFVTGGSAAIGLMPLMDAQQRGKNLGCVHAWDDLPLNWPSLFKPAGDIGVGADPATTEGETSNPFGICITQRIDGIYAAKLLISMKSSDPRKPKAILREIATVIKPKAITIDATSEVYWATEVRQELQGICEVILVKGSERKEYNGENVLMKTYLGNLGSNPFEDGTAALPPDKEVKDDFRLVRRQKGGFDNVLDSTTGRHGDLFDAWKNSIYSLTEATGPAEATAVAVGNHSSEAHNIGSAGRMSMKPGHSDGNGSEETKLYT
jgi:hypothetical protein